MISVIVPVYNGEKYIERCLTSLVAQTLNEFEAVIIDNSSTDKTAEIINRYCNIDSRIKYHFCNMPGVSSTRNYGVNNSNGDYLFFLDADDEIVPTALEELWKTGFSCECDIVVCNLLCFHGSTAYLRDHQDKRSFIAEGKEIRRFYTQKLPTYLMHVIFKLYRKEFLNSNKIGFRDAVSLGEDMLFNVAAFSKAKRIAYINKPLYMHYSGREGLNSQFHEDLVESKLRLHEALVKFLPPEVLKTQSYYNLLLNDIFAMCLNERTTEGIEFVLKLDIIKQLLKFKIFIHLPLLKKLIWICIRFEYIYILRFGVFVWNTIFR